MRTTQDKFMDAIEVIATTYKLEAIKDVQWSNTGWITLQRETSFAVLGRFHYGFYDTYVEVQGTIGKFDIKRPYVKPENLQDLVEEIASVVASEYPRQDP